MWRAATSCPLGQVEVPAFVGSSFDPGVTALFRESWLETVVPYFERGWKKLHGVPVPKKSLQPAQGDDGAGGGVRRSTRKSTKPPAARRRRHPPQEEESASPKVAKDKLATSTPAAPTTGVMIKETPSTEDEARPVVLSLPASNATLDKGKGVVESPASPKKITSKKRSKTSEPAPTVYAPPPFEKRFRTGTSKPRIPAPLTSEIPLLGSGGEQIKDPETVGQSLNLTTGVTTAEPETTPVQVIEVERQTTQNPGDVPSEKLAIVLAPSLDRPTCSKAICLILPT
ncbi:hypothetical protein H6P81_017269 [Aristolochia fimbriata]|uniref:Uncharacterized protein n=1 Tax=Aristolochia fimbriata TaxID=158543 RepID=A0AAV7DZM4_ARIFI|nr:hypothetical protein H6P81_017269 [Aristolochia fimbriata]